MLNINVGLLSDYFLPIILDYTLIASKQSTWLCIHCLGRNELELFDSNLAVNYVTFGSDHQTLVGNPNGRHDVATAPCSGTPILRVSTVTFLPIALKLELEYIFGKPMKCRFQQYYYELNTFLLQYTPLKPLGQWGKRSQNRPLSLEARGSHLIHECLGDSTHHLKRQLDRLTYFCTTT